MRCYDEQLRQLQARCARKKKLDDMIQEMHGAVPNREIE